MRSTLALHAVVFYASLRKALVLVALWSLRYVPIQSLASSSADHPVWGCTSFPAHARHSSPLRAGAPPFATLDRAAALKAIRKRSAPMAELSARARSFSAFSAVHAAYESTTCPQKGAEANCSAAAGWRGARESAADLPILRQDCISTSHALMLRWHYENDRPYRRQPAG